MDSNMSKPVIKEQEREQVSLVLVADFEQLLSI